jgi:formamidopyrimidine-DNA glycosylase
VPELPEVETVRAGLEHHLAGRVIESARVYVPAMLRGNSTDPDEFCAALAGQRLESVTRRGKYLIITLSSGYHVLFHLKMRGHIHVTPREAPEEKYLALSVAFEGGLELRFHDIWRWGEFGRYSAEEVAGHPSLKGMGPEPFSDQFTPEALGAALARKPRTAVKAALLDQTVLAGVGNIYADEALFRSGLAPTRLAGSLNLDEAERLHREIRAVLSEAIGGGGTASDNFFDTEGSAGRYVPRVYDRGGQPCPSCGSVLTRTRIAGRGTVYCTVCQC